MYKILRFYFVIFTLFLMFSFSFVFSVRADEEEGKDIITCEYNDIGLKIIYNIKNHTYETVYDNFTYNDDRVNIILAKWGNEGINDHNVNKNFNEEFLKKTFDTYMCPSDFHFGIKTTFSVGDNLSIKGVLYDIDGITALMFAQNSEHVKDGFSVLKVNEKSVYLVDQKEFENDYQKFLGGKLEVFNSGRLEEGYNACSDYPVPILSNITGALCGGGDLIIGSAYDVTFGDGFKLFEYTELNDFGTIEYNGEYSELNMGCPNLALTILSYDKELKNYKNCGKDAYDCKKISINNINNLEDELKSICSSVLKGQNYEDAGGQKKCLDRCFNLSDTLDDKKAGTDLVKSKSHSHCNMSNRIIKFIANILKWVKYVAPVLVIILGILDFIKAMAAQNDDQMKKAQGKFVKRLIAAALLFIIPFIIEFVLDKFNLVSDDPFCNLI